MTYEQIVAQAKETMSGFDFSKAQGHLAVEVAVTGEGEGVFYIEIADGKVNVQPYDYHDRDCRLTASADTLLKIVSGKTDAVAAFTLGKLKVDGSIDKALDFANKLKAARRV